MPPSPFPTRNTERSRANAAIIPSSDRSRRGFVSAFIMVQSRYRDDGDRGRCGGGDGVEREYGSVLVGEIVGRVGRWSTKECSVGQVDTEGWTAICVVREGGGGGGIRVSMWKKAGGGLFRNRSTMD